MSHKYINKSVFWHAISDKDALILLDSNAKSGLSKHDVFERHRLYGKNILPEIERRSKFNILFSQFKNLPVFFLLIATMLSFFLGRNLEALSIIVVIFMTACIGFIMENSSENAIKSLSQLRKPKSKVLRNGRELEINSYELVQGDIIEFEAGDRVSADCRLLESFGLILDESPLTGESVGVLKDSNIICPKETEIFERVNMCFMGTMVQEGRGKAVVTNIGKETEIGKIGILLEGIPNRKTHFERKIEKLVKRLVIAILFLTFVYIFIGLFQHFSINDLFLTGIVLAIAAVPEGLPAIATITLALGVKKMATNNALVRKIASAETLGSVNVICTDKTGTLTINEPTVKKIILGDDTVLNISGIGFNPSGIIYKKNNLTKKEIIFTHIEEFEDINQSLIFQTMTLCNNAELYFENENWKINGDTTEGSLLVASKKIGIEKHILEEEFPRIWEIPFDTKTRRMITIHKKKDNTNFICVKGAPEEVIPLCSKMMKKNDVIVIDDEKRDEINKKINLFTSEGYRTLLIAYLEIEDNLVDFNEISQYINNNGVIFLGLVCLHDPVRPGIINAIKFIKNSKIRMIMITGDHPLTAKAIAKELGIWNNNNQNDNYLMITGKELEKLSISKLAEKVESISVFARTNPEYKLKIVKALQNKGNIVAMTGDGLNDSPALKQADIGVAMGVKGTDVAKESAELILLDDNFNTITQAIEIGRLILFNIKKFTMYLLSCNISEIMIMLFAIILGLTFPLLPLQLLLMNMVTDTFPALALAAEKGNTKQLMSKITSKKESLISRKEWISIASQSLCMTLVTIFLFLWAINFDKVDVAQTLVFATIGVTQIFHVLNYSSLPRNILKSNFRSNKYMVLATVLSMLIIIFAVHMDPLNRIFELKKLGLSEWSIVFLISSISVFGTNLIKRIFEGKIKLKLYT